MSILLRENFAGSKVTLQKNSLLLLWASLNLKMYSGENSNNRWNYTIFSHTVCGDMCDNSCSPGANLGRLISDQTYFHARRFLHRKAKLWKPCKCKYTFKIRGGAQKSGTVWSLTIGLTNSNQPHSISDKTKSHVFSNFGSFLPFR